MKKSNLSKAELRHQAEEKLGKQKQTAQLVTEVDSQRLIHELQVHQIELELQNEELVQAQAELETVLRQYTNLYDFAPVGYLTLGTDGTIWQANRAGARLLGVAHNELTRCRLGAFVSSASRPAFNVFLEKLLSGAGKGICELEFVTKGGEPLWASLEATCFEAGEMSRAILTDITKRKQAEDELQTMKAALEAANFELQTALTREKELAQIDALTGVSNRRHLYELAGHEFEVIKRYQQPFSVIMFDIDDFKKINDTFGHLAGDQILQRVTQAVCAELRSADTIGRYGGDEFIILLPITNAQQAYPLAERIRVKVAALCSPTPKGNVSVTISLGIVEMRSASPVESVEDVFRRADMAMYAAKQAGCNRTEIGNQ